MPSVADDSIIVSIAGKSSEILLSPEENLLLTLLELERWSSRCASEVYHLAPRLDDFEF
jgi:hypothetical protein